MTKTSESRREVVAEIERLTAELERLKRRRDPQRVALALERGRAELGRRARPQPIQLAISDADCPAGQA